MGMMTSIVLLPFKIIGGAVKLVAKGVKMAINHYKNKNSDNNNEEKQPLMQNAQGAEGQSEKKGADEKEEGQERERICCSVVSRSVSAPL